MPCDTITSTTLDITKADLTSLKAAMESEGFKLYTEEGSNITWRNRQGVSASFNRQTGMTIRGQGYSSNRYVDKIKEAYTGAVVQLTARRLGWQVTKTSGNTFDVVKR